MEVVLDVFVDVLSVSIMVLDNQVLTKAYRDVRVMSASKTDVETDTVGSC